MDLARARYLVGPAGREALAALDPGLAQLDPLALATALRRTYSPAEASALAEQLTLRTRSARLHGKGRDLLLTGDGLEMMTHPLVAARRATRIATLGLGFADLTCGLGGDLLAVAATGTASVGLEREPATALLASANVPAASIVRGDATRAPFDLRRHAILLDPSRRQGGSRRFDPAAFSPPWDTVLALASSAAAAVVKATPGLDHTAIPPAAEAEFVQLGRSMREAVLWFGPSAVPGHRRAVLLPTGATLDSTAPEADPGPVALAGLVHDPHSCVTRAGLVRHLAHALGARLLDPQVAYLTSVSPVSHPLAETFEVIASLPFGVARLREWLRANRFRPAEVRRRAFPVEPDELLRLLGPLDGEPVTLLCTTIAGRRTIVACRPLDRHPPSTSAASS